MLQLIGNFLPLAKVFFWLRACTLFSLFLHLLVYYVANGKRITTKLITAAVHSLQNSNIIQQHLVADVRGLTQPITLLQHSLKILHTSPARYLTIAAYSPEVGKERSYCVNNLLFWRCLSPSHYCFNHFWMVL